MASDTKSPDRLQELGSALDRAERADPELRPRDMRSDRPGFATYIRPRVRRAPWEAELAGGGVWIVPQHSAVRAYWRELKATMQQPVDTEYTKREWQKRRRKFERASATYDDLTIRRDSSYFISDLPSLRAILDARAALIESYTNWQRLEIPAQYQRQIKANKRAGENDARLRRHAPELRERIRHGQSRR